MLKRYVSPGQLRWVGKAWEIRHALRQELKRRDKRFRVVDMTVSARGGRGRS